MAAMAQGMSSGRCTLAAMRHRPLNSSKPVYRWQSVQLRGVSQLAHSGSAQGVHTPSIIVKEGVLGMELE